MARLSLRLLVVKTVLVATLLAPPLAEAKKLPELEVTATNPISTKQAPANSIMPSVIGHENGGITTSIRNGGRLNLAVTAAIEPSEEVALYTESGCPGEPIASGTINEFEGVVGIQVKVSADSPTTFYVRHFDPSEVSEPSDCSEEGFTYWESSTVVTPPGEPPAGEPPAESRPGSSSPPPPHLRTLPSGRANDNSPRILGSAPGADRVKIFASSSCAGVPIFNLSPAELDAGVTAGVPDNSVTNFTGISIANGQQSSCSQAVRYIEDSMPPHTRITMAPGARTRRHKAVFRFADTGEDPLATSFQCRVNHKQWKSCHSPFKLRHLGFHRYILRVRATDEVGNPESKPAKRGFEVIR